MKIYYFISFLLISFAVVSCHKEASEEEVFRKELPGNYDWDHSSSTTYNGSTPSPIYTITPGTEGANYGLKILKNDKAFLYQNGKQIKKGKLKDIKKKFVASPSGYADYYYYIVTFEFDGETYDFDAYSRELNCSIWPYLNYKNNFKAL